MLPGYHHNHAGGTSHDCHSVVQCKLNSVGECWRCPYWRLKMRSCS